MEFYIITFESIHHVLKAEKSLLAKDIKVDIIPTPTDISSNCGMSLQISFGNMNGTIISILDELSFVYKISNKLS